MNLCLDDNRPLEVIYDMPAIKEAGNWYYPERKSMWRFSGILPISEGFIDSNEGYTPLLDYNDHGIAKQYGFDLFIKDEGKGHDGYGQNPTLSFKDRGMAVVINMANHFGLDNLVVPTQGNAGDSLAYYADKLGIQATIIMPDDTPMPIQGSVAALSFHNPKIKLEMVKGTIKEAGELMKSKYFLKVISMWRLSRNPVGALMVKKRWVWSWQNPIPCRINGNCQMSFSIQQAEVREYWVCPKLLMNWKPWA